MCFQGSDIETLGSEAALEHPAELVECLAVEGKQGQDTPASAGKNINNIMCILDKSVRLMTITKKEKNKSKHRLEENQTE